MGTAPPKTRPAIARAMAKVRGLARSEVDLFHRVAPIAQSPVELCSVALFVVRHALTRLSRYRLPGQTAVVHLQGQRYVLGLVSGEVEIFPEIYLERIYDRRDDFIPGPGWTVCDVGANVGLFSLLQAARGAQVHAVEPNQECFGRLLRNVQDNRQAGSISVHNLAMGREESTARLRVPRGKNHSGSLDPDLREDLRGGEAREMLVAVMPLDRLVQQLNISRIDLLKIDVEGWEVEVLAGASTALEVTDRVIVEYHSPALRRNVAAVLEEKGLVPVTDLLCYPPDVGVIYARRLKDRE